MLSMRIFLTLVLLFLNSLTACAAEQEPTVVVFGDSLSAGYGIDADQAWPVLLQSRLKQEGYSHRVVNASISGETTQGGVTRIAPALTDFEPDVVILELGGNDGLRGFPPAKIRQNLATMLAAVNDAGATAVLLGIRIPPNYGPRYTQMFEDIYEELAEEYDVPWIEFFMDGVALNGALMQDDGIHPNAEGTRIMTANIYETLKLMLVK